MSERRLHAYDLAAQMHRPTTPLQRRPAILELRRHGLKPRDIAAATRLALGEVVEALAAVDRRQASTAGPPRVRAAGGGGVAISGRNARLTGEVPSRVQIRSR